MNAPLSDIIVLDLTRALAGPICSRLLSDLGARVIKIEPPDGDLTRSLVPRVDGQSPYFVQYNAGKECVSIDLATKGGRDLFLEMVTRADMVLENYRPKVMSRLGLTYEVLSKVNPRVILGSISGWGHGNSRSNQGAFASAIHAEAGLTEMVARRREEQPRNDPMSHSDTCTGLHALGAVLAALYMRERTGKGQAVEISMAESTLMVNDLAAIEMTGEDPMVGFKGGQNWSPVLQLGNGRYVNVTLDITTADGFKILCRVSKINGLSSDARFAAIEDRVQNRDQLTAIFAKYAAQFDSAEELEADIGVSAVLASEVKSVPELAATNWAEERGAFVNVDTGRGKIVKVPQSPWRFSDTTAGVKPTIAYRGENNRTTLQQLLGLTNDAIDSLEADGVLSSRPPSWHESAS